MGRGEKGGGGARKSIIVCSVAFFLPRRYFLHVLKEGTFYFIEFAFFSVFCFAGYFISLTVFVCFDSVSHFINIQLFRNTD